MKYANSAISVKRCLELMFAQGSAYLVSKWLDKIDVAIRIDADVHEAMILEENITHCITKLALSIIRNFLFIYLLH